MAQVRKFDMGGTLTINGHEFTAEQLTEFLNSGAFNSQEKEALSGVVDAIRNGKDRYLDPNSNSLTGTGDVNEDFIGYFGSERRANRGRSGWGTRKQNWHATINSDYAVRDKALEKLGDIVKYEEAKTAKQVNASMKELRKGSGWFYTDGKYISGPQNMNNEQIIREMFGYLSSDDAGKQGWKTSSWGSELDVLKNWYSGQNAEELIKRIQTNTLTDVDKEVLAYLGYSETEADMQASQAVADKQKFANAGYDYDKWKNIITIDENGNAVLLTNDQGQTAFSSLGGNGNYFFNEGFFSSGENNHLDFLKDHFVINGKVYKASDAKIQGSELYNTLRAAGGFYDKNKEGDWEGANALIRYLWNDETNYANGSNLNDYVEFLYKNPTYRWRAITGAYDAGLKPGEQLIEYYDPNDPVNEYGYSDPRWAVLNQHGEFLRNITSRGKVTGNAATALSGRKIARTQSGTSDYDGLVIFDYTDNAGEHLMTLYKNPANGDLIYSGEIDAASGVDDQNYKIPHDISDILNKYGHSIWEKLNGNKELVERFRHTLGNTVNSGFRDNLVGDDGDILSVKDWQALGLSYADAKAVYNKFNWYGLNKNQGDRSERRAKRLVGMPVLINKHGGSIDKFQPGGAVGTNDTIGHTQYTLNTEFDNPEEAARIGEDEFSAADWADLGALVANGVGVGLGVSGLPIASGVAGLVGSGATLYADIERDGFDWGDMGSFGINAVLDVASAIPFVGSAAESGKIVLKMRKMIPLITKILGMMGVGQGVKTAFDKIKSGDSWTVRDVSTVLNAVAGGIAMKKSGVKGSNRPVKTTNDVDVKVKGKTKKITLTDPEIKKINDATDKKAALTEIVIKKHGVKADDVDVSTSFKSGKWYNPKTWLTKGDVNTAVTETPASWRESIKTDGNAFTRWWSGRGYEQAQYNEFLRTGQWKEIKPSKHTSFSKGADKPVGWENVTPVKGSKKGPDGRVVHEVIGYRGNAPVETNATTTLRTGFKNSWNPWKMTPRQRQLMRKAAIFTPNYVSRDIATTEAPVHYIPVPIPIVQTDLGSRPRFKQGGIIKAQGGLDGIPLPVVRGPGGKPIQVTTERERVEQETAEVQKQLIEGDYKLQLERRLKNPVLRKSLTKEEKTMLLEIFKERKQEAIDAKKPSFVFAGETYSTVPLASPAQEPLPEVLTDILDQPIDNLQLASSLGYESRTPEEIMADYEGIEYVNEVIDEPSLAEEIKNSNYDDETKAYWLKQIGKWTNEAYRDHKEQQAGRDDAGNPPGDGKTLGNTNKSDVFRAMKLANAYGADNDQNELNRQVLLNTLAALPSDEVEYYPSFSDYGMGELYKQAGLKYRNPIVDPNADAFASAQYQKARTDDAIKSDLELGLKLSQLRSDFDETTINTKRNYSTKRSAKEADRKIKTAAGYNGYLTNKGKSIAQKQQIMDNYLTEQLGLYNADREINFRLASQAEQLRFNSDLATIKSRYQRLLDDEINTNVVSPNTTLDDWFAANPTQYKEYMDSVTKLQRESAERSMNTYRQYNGQSVFSGYPGLKKGGKVGSKQRSATDQIWINNQKIQADAMKQLSKQAFEFLKMALS